MCQANCLKERGKRSRACPIMGSGSYDCSYFNKFEQMVSVGSRTQPAMRSGRVRTGKILTRGAPICFLTKSWQEKTSSHKQKVLKRNWSQSIVLVTRKEGTEASRETAAIAAMRSVLVRANL